MTETFYAIDGALGVDLATTHTDPQFSLGKTVKGNDNSEWVYVQASGAIVQYDCVAIDESFQATATVLASQGFGDACGVAVATAFADDDYGWVCIKGAGSNYKVLVDASCNANAQLYVTTVSGGLADSTTSGGEAVDGIVLSAAGDTVAGAEDCIITFPKFGAAS